MNSYAYLLMGAVIGGLVVGLYFVALRRLWRALMGRTRLIRYYWIFVAIFSLFTVATYAVITYVFQGNERQTAISLANQGTALTFAIFVGYFAFAQVMEVRKEKFDREGIIYMQSQNYIRAIESWEQAHSIKPKDTHTLQNLLEVYLLAKDYDKFDQKVHLLEKGAVGYEQIVLHFLKGCRELLVSHITEGEAEIKRTVDYIKADPGYQRKLTWGFDELRESDVYKSLRGDAKQILSNFIKYIDKSMSNDRRKVFENGDYRLEQPNSAAVRPDSDKSNI